MHNLYGNQCIYEYKNYSTMFFGLTVVNEDNIPGKALNKITVTCNYLWRVSGFKIDGSVYVEFMKLFEETK